MPKKNTWKNSKAKELLYVDTIEGQANMQPWQVYMLHPEYQEYPFQNFSANFKILNDTIEKNHARMVADCAAFKEDLKYLSLKTDDTSDPNPKPWHHLEAKDFLKQDIKEGKHKNMAPKDLHKTWDEYMEYPLKVFCKHIYQERNAEVKRNFCMVKK